MSLSIDDTVVSKEELENLYAWVDDVPLSRPKKNIGRDFSDGVLVAEVIKHFFTSWVEIHNYSAANSISQKTYNWNTLNKKVLVRLGMALSREDIENLANAVPGKIEKFLKVLRIQIERTKAEKQLKSQLKVGKQRGNITENLANYLETPNNKVSPKTRTSPSFIVPSERQADPNKVPKELPVDPSIKALLESKDQANAELRKHIENLEARISKMEQIIRIKDAKIAHLNSKLQN